MKKIGLFVAVLVLGSLSFPHRTPAPIVIRPGEGTTFVAPGAEEIPNQKDAQSQFDLAFSKEKSGDIGSAIAGYHKTQRRFPRSDIAPKALLSAAGLYEKVGDLSRASKDYEKLVKTYPRSPDFNTALEGEFRVGTAYLEGARQKVLGVPTLPSVSTGIKSYNFIIQNAPYSRLAPLAQFNIGQALEREGNLKDAGTAYRAVVDRYPTDPAAADALYQIGFVNMQISRTGSYDRNAAVVAKESFQDFLSQYPNSEKAAQAKENLQSLDLQQTGGSLQIAKYYDKQRQYKAAIIYYNEVIREQPTSPESDQAKKRLDVLRAKLGEAKFNQASANTPATPAAGPAGAAAPGAPGAPGAPAAAGTAPAVGGATASGPVAAGARTGDGRLQAQTDTAKRPDYVGPQVSAPTPPPPPPTPAPALDSGAPASNRPAPAQGEPQPPPVPEGDQPALPSQ